MEKTLGVRSKTRKAIEAAVRRGSRDFSSPACDDFGRIQETLLAGMPSLKHAEPKLLARENVRVTTEPKEKISKVPPKNEKRQAATQMTFLVHQISR
jgi:hypothetical protein